MTLIAVWLFIFQSGTDPAQTALAGYKARIETQIFEDGSFWRSVEIDLNPDIEEAVVFKRKKLEESGYLCRRVATDTSLTLTAERVFTPTGDSSEFSDAFGRLKIRRIDHEISFHEVFSNRFLMDEVETSMVRTDTATAKVLLADTEFSFRVHVPGKMVKVNIGEFDRNAAWWKYDIEELYGHNSFSMEAVFSIERQETIAYIGFLISGLLAAVSVLFILKYWLAWRAMRQNKA